MIVKDKLNTMEFANEVVNKMFEVMTKEVEKRSCEDDPAEHIYLLMHIVGSLYAKITVK